MPVPTSNQVIATYTHAMDLPEEVWDTLRSSERNANVILPQMLKSLALEQSGRLLSQHQVWITCTSYNPHPTIEFILSCTEGYMGSYPIFIFTTLPTNQLHPEFLFPRLSRLAEALEQAVPIHRVFSVFAPEPITRIFVDLWTVLTGVESYTDEPYYAASISYCNKRTFVNRQMTIHPDFQYELRPAENSDIVEIAELCYAFAADSDPFILSLEDAFQEAAILVHNKQVWVHRVYRPNDTHGEIASIVAFTRNSEKVATISKVYTNQNWRRRGCAERLVRRVCKHLLLTKESVVLYVAHENKGAAKVYHRVGFSGLNGGPAVDGVDSWLEIGFDRSKVILGHW